MKRWQSYSSDPNAPEVGQLRRQALRRARTGLLLADRTGYLCGLVNGKSVLDVGVVEHTGDAASSPAWLHAHLRRHAAACLGVDVLEADLAALRDQGYDVACVDLTRERLPRQFDVIIGGEVLEHLDAPGPFMRNCAAMLKPGGRLAITAPNPWYANPILKNCFSRSTFVDSADHVAWYDASVLYELGQRSGLQLERFTGVGGAHPRTAAGRLFFALRPLLMGLGIRAELFAKTIIYEFVRQEP